MDNVYTALSLAHIARKRFVVHTSSYAECLPVLRQLLEGPCQVDPHQIVEVDVPQCAELGVDGLAEALVFRMDGVAEQEDRDHTQYRFYEVVVWRNLESLDRKHYGTVLKYLDQLDEYNTNASRLSPSSNLTVGRFSVAQPRFFVVMPVVEARPRQPKLYQPIKEKFWFSQYYQCALPREASADVQAISAPASYRDLVTRAGAEVLPYMFVAPDVQRYIYSLIIHARCHRLSSLAPMHARLLTRAIDNVRLLAEALVAWGTVNGAGANEEPSFVTPEFCKVAFRKVAYWLVDWEQDYTAIYRNKSDCASTEYQRQYEISVLTGDWYGCEWRYVERYIRRYATVPDAAAPTGFLNRLVDDVLATVQPPV